jgi:Asp-tRNA(Asn)/Glu-tRNA(Gln) amidotransferase A subunit family amidase
MLLRPALASLPRIKKPMNIHALRTSERALHALDLARRIEAGELTAAAVLEMCEQAIAKREAEIGAFAALDLARAKKFAASSPAGPLRGLPVGVKDIVDTVDFPTEYGSAIYAGHRPHTDAAVVSLIRRAGGLVLGKTVTTEFAHMHPGKTRNPRNPQHTPGGSSSGSAAAVAACMVPIAIGSQTGGSVIRPAAFCGVAGFKPSYQMLPTVGMKCFSWQLDTVGLFAASVGDVAFAAAAIADRDLRVDRAAPAAPRIAVLRMHIWSEASEAMHAALEAAARAASAAGARVEDMSLPPALEDAWDAHPTIQNYEAYRALAFEYDHHRDRIAPTLRKLLEDAAEITAERYDEARRVARRARQLLSDLLDDVDVILTPSAPGAAPHGLQSTGNPIFNRLWTLMGTPCVNVPGLADDAGLPLGVQVVARFGRDKRALEAALFLEQAIARSHS